MQDKQARKKFAEVKNYIESNSNNSPLNKCQQDLQRNFQNLNQIIAQYTMKKQQNQKKYSNSIQEGLSTILQQASQGITEVSNITEQKNENWGRLNQKMQIYMMLRQNLKQMFNFNGKHNSSSNGRQ